MNTDLPKLGFGLGISANWPKGFKAARSLLADGPQNVKFLEIYPGCAGLPDFAAVEIRRWKDQGVPMTFHAAGLDLWSAGEPDRRGVALTREIHDLIDPVWTTQDLMVTRAAGARAGVLLGAILTEEAVEATSTRYADCSAALNTPLLLENAPYQILVGEMNLGGFFARIAARAGCGLTLDIGHIVASAMVAAQSPFEVLEGYPFERVVEIHVSGGRTEGAPPRYIDDHDADLPEQSLTLLRDILPRCTALRAVTYEVQAPALEALRPRLHRVRAVLAEAAIGAG